DSGGVLVASLGYAGWRFVSVGRLDGTTGTIVSGWPPGGVPVCWVAGNQDAPGIVSDATGGAIVVWLDSRNGSFEQVYAQRVSAGGVVAPGWPADGKPVCTYPSTAALTCYSGYRRGAPRYSLVVSGGLGGASDDWSEAARGRGG